MRFVLIAMTASALLLAGEDKAQSGKTVAAKTAATEDRPAGVPRDAQEIQPFLYRYTDAQGKKWLYRQTPFGLSKWEDKPVDAAAAAARAAENSVPVKVVDLGESYRFEKETPFGPTYWVRRKAELTEDESALVKRDQERRSKIAEKP
jgi:hypothetical protein